MKKMFQIGWLASIVLYIGCVLLMQNTLFQLFSLQGEVSQEMMAQIQTNQTILATGKWILLVLSLIGFGCCGMLSLQKRTYLLWGLLTVAGEIVFSVAYAKWMTGASLTFVEAYQFQPWFWIVLLGAGILFYGVGKRGKIHE